MTQPTDTNPRLGKRSALLGKIQAAEFTAEDDLSDALNVWASPFRAEIQPRLYEESAMTSGAISEESERFDKAEFPADMFRSLLTPDILDLILNNNWGKGTTANTVTTYALANQPTEWLTLAWVENRRQPNLAELVRIRDAWIHAITFNHFKGVVRAECQWIARKSDSFEGVPTSITLPLPPMGPDGSTLFPMRGMKLFRDPDGDNEEFSAETLTVDIMHRGIHEWAMTAGTADVTKGGKTKVRFEFRPRVNDESWRLLKKALANSEEPWRIEFRTKGATFRIEMASVKLNFDGISREGKDLPPHTIKAEALAKSGSSVDITLTR